MTAYTLGDFLTEEINRRHMNVFRFAQFIGVSHTTVNKFLDYGKKDVGYPSVDFVIKLAKATNTDISVIMALIDPTVPTGEHQPLTGLLAEEIESLTDHQRKMVAAFIQTIKTYEEK